MDKSRRLLSFVGGFVKDASDSRESLQDRSASHQFAWRVEDDEVAGLQSAHQSLLTVAQLAEAALNGTEHMVVACDPNPMAFVCHLYECQFEPPSRLKAGCSLTSPRCEARISLFRIRREQEDL